MADFRVQVVANEIEEQYGGNVIQELVWIDRTGGKHLVLVMYHALFFQSKIMRPKLHPTS